MEKKYLIYQITNLINEKIYIGIHITDNEEDGYFGSGTALKNAIRKYGKENFRRIILERCSCIEELCDRERMLVNDDFVKRKDTYNIITGGRTIPVLGKVVVRDLNGNFFSVDCDDPRYLAGELKHPTKGRVTVVDSFGKSMSLPKEDDRIAKEGLKNPFKDKTHSRESKSKISEGHKGSKNVNFGKVYITNIRLEENKLVKKEEVEEYLESGWMLGRKYKFF